MLELRNSCVAKAHELGMGIAAMKALAFGVLGAWAEYVVPDFDKKRRGQLPSAAIRYVLDDDRVDLLVIGMRLLEEVDANIQTLAGDVTYTSDDRSLLAEYSAKAFESDALRRMRID
jgi:predicted aldo/keto reductase-like oxidoreductase